jgi:hypothetical protein
MTPDHSPAKAQDALSAYRGAVADLYQFTLQAAIVEPAENHLMALYTLCERLTEEDGDATELRRLADRLRELVINPPEDMKDFDDWVEDFSAVQDAIGRSMKALRD